MFAPNPEYVVQKICGDDYLLQLFYTITSAYMFECFEIVSYFIVDGLLLRTITLLRIQISHIFLLGKIKYTIPRTTRAIDTFEINWLYLLFDARPMIFA